MKLNEYQELAMRTKNSQLKGVDELIYAVLKLNGEAGEVAELVGKFIGQGRELDPEEVLSEIGDVLWYVALLASTLDVTLEDIAKLNILKLKNRYPDGFDAERSKNRGGTDNE